MFSKTAFLILISLATAGCSQAHDTHPELGDSPLADADYQNRLLVMCVDNDAGILGGAMYGQQYFAVAEDWPGHLERDTILVLLHDTLVTSWMPFRGVDGRMEVRQRAERNDVANLRERTNCKPGNRGIHLIGKDTGLKKSWPAPVTNQELFAFIDAMPMRQQEMRRAQD